MYLPEKVMSTSALLGAWTSLLGLTDLDVNLKRMHQLYNEKLSLKSYNLCLNLHLLTKFNARY